MARAYIAYLRRTEVPTHAPLQAAIKHLRFNLNLNSTYTPFSSPAYLPCDIEGEDGGFNIRFGNINDDPPAAAVGPLLADRDVALKFSWGGDTREHLCVLIVCAALAEVFSAVVYDGEKAALATSDALQKRAKATLETL